MISTLWILEQIGQLSANIEYNDPTVLYDSPVVQYGGENKTVWVLQDGGQ